MEKETGKVFTLFISNGDMNDIIKIIKSLKDSVVLIDGVTETVKHKIKHKGVFIGALLTPSVASIVQTVISAIVKGLSKRGVKQEEDIWKKFLVLLYLLSNI